MNDPLPTWKLDKEASYVQEAVWTMARLWNDERVNRSGLRAAFCRWHPLPGAPIDPLMDLRGHVWSEVGPPEGDHWSHPQAQHETIARAAAIVALRAAAGEAAGEPQPLGAALFRAGLSDHRLMRLLTEQSTHRFEALHRALRRVARQQQPVHWNEREVRRLLHFLYGDDRAAREAANGWASDFFRTRHTDTASAEADTETPTQTV